MANRSMLYAVSAEPTAEGPAPDVLGLAEYGYDIPWVFQALASAGPRRCRSLIFDAEPELAIAFETAAGLARLEALRAALGPDHPNAKALGNAIAFLSKPQMADFPLILLEPAEILALENRPLAESFAALFDEIAALTPEAILAAAQKPIDPSAWGEDCWNHILYFEPAGTVRAALDPGESLLFTDPEHLLRHADVLPSCVRLKTVHLNFNDDDDDRLDAAISALASIPRRFGLMLHGRAARLPAAVAALPNLTSLGAGQLGLTALPDTFASGGQIEALYLQQNAFTDWPAVIGALPNLKHLSLWGHPIGRAPDWIGRLTQLESLLFKACDLEALPEELFTLPKLSELDVSENPRLTQLPERIADLQALELFKAYQCGLTSLPDGLGRLPQLKRVYIAHNRLTVLPKSLHKAPLEVLSLAGNPLRKPMFGTLSFRARQVYWR